MNTHQKGWITKRMALLTVLTALFFGTFAAASANPSYYVRWHGTPHYECEGIASSDIEFDQTDLDYYAASDVVMIETNIIDTPTQHRNILIF